MKHSCLLVFTYEKIKKYKEMWFLPGTEASIHVFYKSVRVTSCLCVRFLKTSLTNAMDRLTFILYIQGNSFTIQRKSPIKIVALPPPLDRYTTLFLDLAGLNINYGEYQRMTPSKFWAGSGPNRPSFFTKNIFSVFWGYLYIKPPPGCAQYLFLL